LVLVDGALIVGNHTQKSGLARSHIGCGGDTNTAATDVYEVDRLDAASHAEGRRAVEVAASVPSRGFLARDRLLAEEVL